MPFTILRKDITKMHTDAIVNAANTELAMGGGVCGAIFHAAGAEQLQKACSALSPIHTGECAVTPAFALPCKYIIHAAGPVYRAWDAEKSEMLLRLTYTNALNAALSQGCESIAFPLISSGIYGYPKYEALRTASEAIREFLLSQDMDVYLIVFDQTAFAVSQTLFDNVENYLDAHFTDKSRAYRRTLLPVEEEALRYDGEALDMEKMMAHLEQPFAQTLFSLIDKKGKTDAEVYKKANIDRKLFNKIKNVDGYTPKKRTILALAVALELSLYDTKRLLAGAGYALSPGKRFDVIVEYFIMEHQYDIFRINETLFQYGEEQLGS